MSEALIDGLDSKDVPVNVRQAVFTKQFGRCAAPGCPEILIFDNTKVGECCHIIPKVVGSHPREDHLTPLEDRRKEPNLLYLCEKHHKAIDNKLNAHLYTADTLREWKRSHEAWAAGVTKNSPFLTPQLKTMISNFETLLAEQATASQATVLSMLDICREFLERNLLNEASALLSKINHLLTEANDNLLTSKCDLLGAILLLRNGQIPEAKKQLHQIIQDSPNDVEAMLEYIELCDNAPEPDDNLEAIESVAYALASGHPRLAFIELRRKIKKHEVINISDVQQKWADDIRLNAKFIYQYALLCDVYQMIAERDSLINRCEQELPTSPRPHLFKALFRFSDLTRSNVISASERTHAMQEVVRYTAEEKSKATSKDPSSLSDQISWLMHELRLAFTYENLSEAAVAEKSLQLRNELVSLVERHYFDSFIDGILVEFLSFVRIESHSWQKIIRRIQQSKVPLSQALIELLFLQALQYPDQYPELETFIENYDHSNLQEILRAILNKDSEQAAEKIIARKNSDFSLYIVEFIADPEFGVALTELLQVDEEQQKDLLYARFRLLAMTNREEEAVNLIASLPLDNTGPFALHTIEQVTSKQRRWHLFIPTALRLLDLDIPLTYRNQLYTLLSAAYFEQGDDSNAIYYAEEALSQPDLLTDHNAQELLHVLEQSLARKGRYDEAGEKIQHYGHLKRSYPLLLEEAALYFRSNLSDRYDKTLELLINAFTDAGKDADKLYLFALPMLIELEKNNKIPSQDEPIVENDYFIKLTGFDDHWFYIGEEGPNFGVERIIPGTANYKSVFHKALAEDINWPPDRYSNPNIRRTILTIVTPSAFLLRRAHEQMLLKAKIGDAGVWSVQIMEQDGSLDLENLKRFFEEQFNPQNNFFDSYISESAPFSFLCSYEGSLTKALSKLLSEKRGFIYTNISSQDIDAQYVLANEVLNGAPCFIDGFSAYMLAEAGLLEDVLKVAPNIGVSTSIIKLLREIAGEFDTPYTSPGSLSLINGTFHFNPRNEEKDEVIRQNLLLCADLLDNLTNKVIGKTYPEVSTKRNLDSMLPSYFVDAFRYSQEKGAYLFTDDARFTQAYKFEGESAIPKHFSSFSIVRGMAENKLITWESYFRYFARLAAYRYRLLPISVNDLLRAVFPPSLGGLITSAPQNIFLLNLPLTLSQEYGVNEEVAIGIVATFFTNLIIDGTITPDVADKIFSYTIIQGLSNRDRRIVAREVLQICRQNMQNNIWLNQNSYTKLEILRKQLFGFVQGLDLL